MPATYEAISTTTLGSAASTITFSSIPGTYTDLRLVIVPTVASGTGYLLMRFNSNSATNYSLTEMYGTGSSVFSARSTSQTEINLTGNGLGVTTTPHLYTVDIFSYAGSTNKTCLITASEDENGSGYVIRQIGLWRQTSAITSISFTSSGSNYASGTTATLYGILKA